MFPGAILSAFLGKTGGRLADQKGSPYLFYLASNFIAGATSTTILGKVLDLGSTPL